MQHDMEEAIKVLKRGGIVIFPTDTAFAIGCRVDNEDSVQKLFSIRNRPLTQPVSILVDTVTMAKKYVSDIPKEVLDKLIEPYWPGALTIVLQSRIENVSSLVRGGGDTVGIRIPNHQIARTLIREVGVGILGPSANFHSKKTPYKIEDLDSKLVKLVNFVVPGECSVKVASTIIDCSVMPWRILREGAIKIQHVILGSSALQKDSRIRSRDSGQVDSGSSTRMTDIILYIDTSSNQKIIVEVQIDGKKDIIEQKITLQKAQAVLPIVEKLIKKHKIKLSDIESIQVNTGPGSFTGIRVGIAIANALAFALKIPVNKGKNGNFAVPSY